MTPYYAYIPILYPESVEKMIGVAEVVSGGGFMIGPVLGSLFYSFGGYIAPFIVFGTASILVVPMIYFLIMRKEDNKVEI